MGQERIFRILYGLGLTETDTQVYIFLAKKGPQASRDICRTLRISRHEVSRSLGVLQTKGIVNATLEHPTLLEAISFEKVLDLFVKSRIEEAIRIQQGRKEIKF